MNLVYYGGYSIENNNVYNTRVYIYYVDDSGKKRIVYTSPYLYKGINAGRYQLTFAAKKRGIQLKHYVKFEPNTIDLFERIL